MDYRTTRWIFVLTDEWGIPTPVYSGRPATGGNNRADAVVLGQFRVTGYQAAANGLDELAWTCAGATMRFSSNNPGPPWVEDVLHTLCGSNWILDPRSQAKQSRKKFTARVKRITDYIASRTAECNYIYQTTGGFLVSSEDV
jgi:hypothetical protein